MKSGVDEWERDRTIIAAATPGPWIVHAVDDHYCMNARTVASMNGSGELDDHENNIAIVLLQVPRLADMSDGRWDENAEFIARARTRWPEAVERVAELERQVDALRRELADLRQQRTSS